MTSATDIVWNQEEEFEPLGTVPVVGDRVKPRYIGDGVVKKFESMSSGAVMLILDNGVEHYLGRWDPLSHYYQADYRVYKRPCESAKFVENDDRMLGITEKMENNPPKSSNSDVLSLARDRLGLKEGEYGLVENTFPLIAELWSKYLGISLTPSDVAAMMILLKLARHRGGHGKRDNWVDIAGYAHAGDVLKEAE